MTSGNNSFDAVVVGGGPGGSATAYHLAAAGHQVLVVDKAAFPRDKVCGDGLTPRAVRCLLDMGVPTSGDEWARVDGLRVHGGGVAFEMPWPTLEAFPGYGLVRTRRDFDALLLDHARGAGATVWEETSATAPIVDSRGVVVGVRLSGEGSPEEVRAPVVVAADGAASRLGVSLGGRRVPDRPMGVAVRTYYHSPRASDRYMDSYIELRRGDDLLPGYGWIFPLSGGLVNVGVGLLNTSSHFRNVDYKRLLENWVAGLPAEWNLTPQYQLGKIQGGPLPMGSNRRPIARPGLMLVGDAAGVVNPFNGEGIAYAMETGRMAAESACEALASGDPFALKTYAERVRDAYDGYHVVGKVFVRAIGNATVMRALTRYALPRRRLMLLAFRLMGNLVDPRSADAADRLINGLCRLALVIDPIVGA